MDMQRFITRNLILSCVIWALTSSLSSIVFGANQKTIQIISPVGRVETCQDSIVIKLNLSSPPSHLKATVKDKEGKESTTDVSVAAGTNSQEAEVKLAVGENSITLLDPDDSAQVEMKAVRLAEALCPDQRDNFEATAYLGIAIDSFAAGEINRYINPKESGILKERAVGGFDFAYRISGQDGKPAEFRHPKLWLFGETVHGVRSADVDCKAVPDLPTCSGKFNPATAGQQTLYLLRNATSLEAFAGFRYEFWTLQKHSANPANLYFKSQFGFLTVAGTGGDVMDVHQYAALGLTATKGKFMDSFFEVGIGKTDLFLPNKKKNRLKLDGFLFFDIFKNNLVRPFVEMTVDSDAGGGSDSIQSYIGIQFDLTKLGDIFSH